MKKPAKGLGDANPDTSAFEEVVRMIRAARQNALREANAELVRLYWNVGQYISRKLAAAEWGDKVVEQLAVFIFSDSIRDFLKSDYNRSEWRNFLKDSGGSNGSRVTLWFGSCGLRFPG